MKPGNRPSDGGGANSCRKEFLRDKGAPEFFSTYALIGRFYFKHREVFMLLPRVPVEISYRQVLRSLGTTEKQRVHPDLQDQINQMILLGKSLCHPAATLAQVPVVLEGERLSLGGVAFDLPELNKTLKGCTAVSVAAVTVGETIDREVEQLFQTGQATRAVILDAVATVAAEEAANQVIKLLSGQQKVKGLYPTPRLGPGYRGVKMDCLPLFLRLADSEQISVTCNEYFQMNPVKSLCFAVGWSPVQQKDTEKCNFCQQGNCPYRAVRTEGENGVVF